MEVNTIFHNRYRLKKFLGNGAYSEVWLSEDEIVGNTEVALKIFAPDTGLDDYGLDMFAHEFSLVLGVSDLHILKPLHYDSYDRRPYLVLPYYKKGSAKKLIGKISEKEAWSIINDVAKGLRALHSMTPPIIHQDIKPDNIMVSDDGHYLITDFGVSTHLHSTLRKSVGESFSKGGTRAYMAPERFSRHKTPVMASDVYSLGATIFELLSSDTPFGEEGGLLQKSGADIPEMEGNYSSEIKEIIDKCLSLNPWDRPTTEALENISSVMMESLSGDFSRKTTPFQIEESDNEKIQLETIKDSKHPLPIVYLIILALVGVVLGVILALII